MALLSLSLGGLRTLAARQRISVCRVEHQLLQVCDSQVASKRCQALARRHVTGSARGYLPTAEASSTAYWCCGPPCMVQCLGRS